MTQENQPNNTLEAFVYLNDFIPTLYITGEIKTNGEKPTIKLVENDSPGNKPNILLLHFDNDVFDPNGKELLKIKDFEKQLQNVSQYLSVSIIVLKGNPIDLAIVKRTRK